MEGRIIEIPVTVMGAGHRREKMLEAIRMAKYRLNKKYENVGRLE
jgi:hypothetical protein